MADDTFNIDYVAELARIELSSEEKETLGRQLGDILQYVEKLKELDVDGIEPTAHSFPLTNIFRDDDVRPSLPHEAAMRNAPNRANGLFLVPKIVE